MTDAYDKERAEFFGMSWERITRSTESLMLEIENAGYLNTVYRHILHLPMDSRRYAQLAQKQADLQAQLCCEDGWWLP